MIFGAGVIGSVCAGKLALAGHSVSVLALDERSKKLKLNGLLLSENGKQKVKIIVAVISELKNDDIYDYIFVTLRKDQLKRSLHLLGQNQSKNFVFMVNTSNGYSNWTHEIGFDRLISAFPGTGGKVENGIVHFSLISKFIQPTTLGEIRGKTTQRINDLVKIFRNAGFPTSISKKMDCWQKSHVAMVCPLAYGIYFDGGNNCTLSKNKMAIIQMSKALKKTFSFLKKSGVGIEPAKLNIFRLIPFPILKFFIPIVLNTKWAETVISNHALTARSKMQMLFNDFISLAEDKGYQLNELKKLSIF